jgi:predicted O-linked N-acetylglucosamine transferase (SPINDLY family)
MGVAGPVAWSPEQYVALAVRLGTDRDYRDSLRAEIARRKDVLFEGLEVVREHERFFERVTSPRRTAH